VILDEKRKLEAEYDILNFWNFLEGVRHNVKVGRFSTFGPHGQKLSLHEDLKEWNSGTLDVGCIKLQSFEFHTSVSNTLSDLIFLMLIHDPAMFI
jgi:hypothetical protein